VEPAVPFAGKAVEGFEEGLVVGEELQPAVVVGQGHTVGFVEIVVGDGFDVVVDVAVVAVIVGSVGGAVWVVWVVAGLVLVVGVVVVDYVVVGRVVAVG
jgi:hypothetical protein